MSFSRDPYQDAISKNDTIGCREQAYYRQRFLHSVFEKIILKFAQRAERDKLTKARLARLLGKDPSQINRLLALPSNMTLEMLSDLSLAMGAEPEVFLADFDDPPKHNYIHPSMVRFAETRQSKETIHSGSKFSVTGVKADAPSSNGSSIKTLNAVAKRLEVA